MLGIIIAALAGLYFAYFQVIKGIKWQIAREVKLSFDVLPWSVAPEERLAGKRHQDQFYVGSAGPDPSVYIALDLDARRRHTEALVTWVNQREPGAWFHIAVSGDRKHGRTVFMARLAHELARQRGLTGLGRRYHVVWCRITSQTPFRRALREGRVLDADLLAEYRKYFVSRLAPRFSKKHLIVFVDDLFCPELLDTPEVVESTFHKEFLRTLMRLRISVVTSSSRGDTRIEETEQALKLKLSLTDAESILAKLAERGVVPTAFASSFIKPDTERLYGTQLFAFFSLLLSELRRQPMSGKGLIREFDGIFALR